MRPDFVLAAFLLALLAAGFRMIWSAARREHAFIADRVDAVDALARLARVRGGTEIDILAFDLGLLVRRPGWRYLIEDWLRKGVRLRYLVQESDDEGRKSLHGLTAAGFAGEVALFVLKAGGRKTDLAADAKDFHFVIFRSPDQLWLEAGHSADGLLALDCEYVPAASGDERWEARSEDFEALVSKSDEVNLRA